MEVPLPARDRGAGGAARGDQRLQVPAAPLDQGGGADGPQDPARDLAGAPAPEGQGGGDRAPDGEHLLRADAADGGVDAAGPGDPQVDAVGAPPVPDRPAPVLHGDHGHRQLLPGIPARPVRGLEEFDQVPAAAHGDRHQPVRQQRPRRPRGTAGVPHRLPPDAEVRGRRRLEARRQVRRLEDRRGPGRAGDGRLLRAGHPARLAGGAVPGDSLPAALPRGFLYTGMLSGLQPWLGLPGLRRPGAGPGRGLRSPAGA